MQLAQVAPGRGQSTPASDQETGDGQDDHDQGEKADAHDDSWRLQRRVAPGRHPSGSYFSGPIGVSSATIFWVAASSGSATRP